MLYHCIVESSDGSSSKVTTVVATPGPGPDQPIEVSYTDAKVIGNGSFGVVYQARLTETSQLVAIKKVLQDKRFKVCIISVGHLVEEQWTPCATCYYMLTYTIPCI